MNKVNKNFTNEAIGVFPLLLTMFLNIYFSYTISFIIGIACCFLFIFLFRSVLKNKIFQFLLIPTTITLVLSSLFFVLKIQPVLFQYSTLIAEVLMVVVLAFTGFSKKSVMYRVRNSQIPSQRRILIRSALNESYFIGQILQNLFTLHLFIILLYVHLPDSFKTAGIENLLYHYLGVIIGIIVIIYGHIRVKIMHGSLKKEVWLPVLNEKGRVIGSMARSISEVSAKKYYHPVVRIAVVYNGMLYLIKRSKDAYVSPDLLDYPLHQYVLFRHSIEGTVNNMLGKLAEDKSLTPRFMIRYTFENDKAKHLVSLYAVSLHSEQQLEFFTGGKLWTVKQIQDNMKAGIFCEYFEKEFPYLQNTILLAEQMGSPRT